jgi:NTP pyrophosphatase (non-canonical NTP hydrolase)
MVPKQTFLRAVNDLAESVYEFHERFRVPYLSSISSSDDVMNTISYRIRLQCEELGELSSAVNKEEFEDIFGEAADVLYVALGTILVSSGYGTNACKTIVQKNLKKTTDTHRMSESGKVIKR